MKFKRRQVILVANIDYPFDNNIGKKTGVITEGGELGNHTVEDLLAAVKFVIENKLRNDAATIFGIHLKTEITATRFGSVSVFFTALLTGLSAICSYKEFFDSIQLIREHAELLLRSEVQRKFVPNLQVDVSVAHPRLDDPREMRVPRMFRKHFSPDIAEDFMFELGELYSPRRAGRDAFFWFLLISCVLLVGVLGWLVYAAVVKTYFQ